jgi:hypothetical protein
MMNSFRHNFSILLRVSLLLLFAVHYAGIHCFPHTHLVGNELIVHSHPLSKAAHHEHTTTELVLLSAYSDTRLMAVSPGIELPTPFVITHFLHVAERPERVFPSFSPSFFLRPPPEKMNA